MVAETQSELWRWLNEILNGSQSPSSDCIEVLCKPTAYSPEFICSEGRAGAPGLYRFHDGKGATSNVVGLVAYHLAKLGVLGHLPMRGVGERTIVKKWRLLDHLEERLEVTGLSAAVTVGPPKSNRKPVIQLIAEGETIGFAKVGWTPVTDELIATEFRVLSELRTVPDSAKLRLPTPMIEFEWGGHRATVISSVPTKPTWTKTKRVDGGLLKSLADLSDGHAHPVPLLDCIADERLATYIDVDALKAKYSGTNLKAGLFHGDLTPWNVSSFDGGVSVWDWEFASTLAPLGFDELHVNFEYRRRFTNASQEKALNDTLAEANEVAGKHGQNPEALCELYVCELTRRELLLAGQRWTNSETDLLPHLDRYWQAAGLR